LPQQGELKLKHLQSKICGCFSFSSNFQADFKRETQQIKLIILILKSDNGGVVFLAL
jgi:hypothetical protein